MADGGGFCQASGCENCGSLSFSSEWFQAFGVVLCHQCKRDEALISKGNALTKYCLTVKDLQGLGCLTKDNPQKKNWSSMKLYLRSQVEERARRKHGDLETIQQLRHDKAQAKVQGWLAKRTRAQRECEDEDDDEEQQEGDVGAVLDPGVVRVKLSAAAARVRARLASEYEALSSGADGMAGSGSGGSGGEVTTKGAAAVTGPAAEGDDADVEVF